MFQSHERCGFFNSKGLSNSLAICLGVVMLMSSITAHATEWPTHVLRFLVPFPAGGSVDLQARAIADELSRAIGKPVIVDNKPGAGGNLAAAELARSPKDGHTLFIGTASTQAAAVSLYEKLSYDPVKDFEPLTSVTIYPLLIATSDSIKAKTLGELIETVKREGDNVTFGSAGVGAPSHLAGELFNQQVGTRARHIPYRGQPAAITDLISGRIDMMFPSVPDALSMLKSGNMRALAIMADRRSPLLPDVPTTAELGYPTLKGAIWTGVYTTSGVAPDVVERLSAALIRIVESKDFREKFEAMGYDVKSSSPEALRAFASEETQRWGAVVKASGIRLN